MDTNTRCIQREMIKDPDVLEYVVFCIENLAIKLNVSTKCIYRDLTEKGDILHSYIIPAYGPLHTQGKDYILEDIQDVLRENGVELSKTPMEQTNMTANPILLQMKYARVIAHFAKEVGLSLDDALDFFYKSQLYPLLHEGISSMHCMSDLYLAEDLEMEYNGNRSWE